MPLDVLYEDNHLLVVVKPSGLATMGVAADKPSLLVEARDYIKRRYQKPGNVYLGVVSRLDAPVSGVVLLARTSKAAARLTEQFKSRDVEKVYWAVVTGAPPPAGECVDWLVHDDRHRRVHVAKPGAAGAQEARLSFRRLMKLPRGWLLEVRLETGRKHQIRVQLAERGWPVLGDRKYGSSEIFVKDGIALHARRLTCEHPTREETLDWKAPLPRSWQKLGLGAPLPPELE